MEHSKLATQTPPDTSQVEAGVERDSDNRSLLTVTEVAEILRCSRAHVYNLMAGTVSGVRSLPAIRLGRKSLVRLETLQRWQKELESTAGSDEPADDDMLRSSSAIDP